MAWRSDSWRPKAQVGLYYEERCLLHELLFDCFQAKSKAYETCTDEIDKRHLENELEMIIGLRHKMQI